MPVRLEVFGVDGRRVALLAAGVMAAGTHERVWQGTDHRQRSVAAGVYFVSLKADGRRQTRAVTMVK